MKKLVSSKIKLEKVRNRDIDSLYSILKKNPEITKFLRWNIPHSVVDMKEKNQKLKQLEVEKKLNRFGIFHEKQIIGIISLSNLIFKTERRIKNVGELGYWISPKFSGKGFATEAAFYMLDHGFENIGLQKIKAACVPENKPSLKILQKLGMRKIGLSKNHYFEFNRWWDMELYELTKSEWEKQKLLTI